MKPDTPPAPAAFETEEQLFALIQEGLDSGEATLMTQEEWRRLREEFGISSGQEHKRAS